MDIMFYLFIEMFTFQFDIHYGIGVTITGMLMSSK